ncbi:methyltransferase-domain-containing protein [Gymnopilus junonius]|uniref:Ribosomal RNA-processing protein 8 n=1 Tax=Gymnopilus junonius TaxID=109634 RepID=A0A9P5TV59_GYMJU|nr:methyltransferase-domain-containing protein [Gymnopilus junonius]
MALFHVSGWSVQNTPVRDEFQQTSKKRKRPSSNDTHKMEAAHVNIEKLTSKLKQIGAEGPASRDENPDTTSTDYAVKSKAKRGKKARNQKPTGFPDKQEDVQSLPVRNQKQDRPSKKSVNDAEQNEAGFPSQKAKTKLVDPLPSNAGLTTLQKSMKEKLEGARFRLINENLYKSDSHAAHQIMRNDPSIFEEYHTGFRHQVLSWPANPVQHYVSLFKSYPRKTVIADLGCGDALLAKSLIPEDICVISFDLVSDNGYVVEADICERIPLPGSEGGREVKSSGEGQVVDVVVCALSLMGVNWPTCLREAWRILKPGGQLHIAEVTSRFTDLESFLNLVGSLGFRLKAKDESNTHFISFEFIKIPRLLKADNDLTKLLSKVQPVQGPDLSHPLMTTAKINVLSHPLVNSELSKLRQKSTTSKEFREGVETLSLLLGYEATRTLEEAAFNSETPVAPFIGSRIKSRIGLTPILRAGLGMTDALLRLFPSAPVYHLGLFREKVTLQPVECEIDPRSSVLAFIISFVDYSKLPPSPPIDQVFLLDPLIATGGTACAALGMIVEWGISLKDIKLLCILASEDGLKHVQAEYPDLEVWVAGIDKELTNDGIISPGLGDSGDRLFNTIR